MTELDEVWTQMLITAGEKAALAGRADVAEYLRLKATNDAIRTAGVNWLLEAVVESAFNEAGRHTNITVDRQDGHAFAHGSSTMAGALLTVRFGVRCLSVEAGWTRTPSHGIMRGHALARANISHFGRARDGESLRLVQGDDLPGWLRDEDTVFTADAIRRHINKLLDR
ncbi:MAG TPA: hypothetical protein VGO43_05365 [Pyrinomonadaceae bacterium]|jgi:hypothetical protein|nr:hypothetical protein [Pyrinomonadaceae bacterium]